MTFVLLHADRLRSVATADPLVPAAEVDAVRDAAALLVEAGRLRDAAERDIAAALAAAKAEGLAQGRAEGEARAQAELTETLVRIEAADTEREARRSADVARVAIEVVRRIAGDIGDAAVIAALAQRAAASLVGDGGITVRVADDQAAAVRERLAGHADLQVEGDPALTGLDCVLETPLGRTLAGLETQLAAIERAWTGR